MMRRLIVILFSLFITLLPLTAQEDELPLAYLLREDDTPIALFFVWADNRYDPYYAGSLAGEFGFRQGVSWESRWFCPLRCRFRYWRLCPVARSDTAGFQRL